MKFYDRTISKVEKSDPHTWKMSYHNVVYTQTIVLMLSKVEDTHPIQYTVTVEDQTRAKTKGPQTITTIDALLTIIDTEYESYAEGTLTQPEALIAKIIQTAREGTQLFGYDTYINGSREPGRWSITFYYDGRRDWADSIELKIQVKSEFRSSADHAYIGFTVTHTTDSTYSENTIVGTDDLKSLVDRKVEERRAAKGN
jgi:hypothetical protein